MKIEQFPINYRNQVLNNNQSQEINNMNNQRIQNINNISKQYKNKENEGLFAIGCLILGIICGFINFPRHGNVIYPIQGSIAIIGYALVGLIIGFILDTIALKKHKGNQQILNHQIHQYNNQYETNKKQIEDKYNRLFNTYIKQFSSEAIKQSTHYSSSLMCQELSQWLMNHFHGTIRSINRNSYVRINAVAFRFSVSKDKITCFVTRDLKEMCLGVYDLNAYGFASFSKDIDEASFAYALSSMIEFNTLKAFPKDINGGNVSIDIKHSYSFNEAIVHMIYRAK